MAAVAAVAVAAAGEAIADPPKAGRVSSTIEVLDAFAPDGRDATFTLTRRSPTLDGSVPLRAAQACVPFLAGNAFGLQLVVSRAIVIERRIGRSPRVTTSAGVPLDTLHAAALPRLVAQGLVPRESGWYRAFASGPVHESRGVLRLFTGLLVRAPKGAWLRVSSTANRRSTSYVVDEVFVSPDDGFVPLVLSIRSTTSAFTLDGEIATLALLPVAAGIDALELAEAPSFGEAHARFYDQAYFDTKRGETTRKYKRMVVSLDDAEGEGPTRVVRAGPCDLAIERRDACLTRDAAVPVSRAPGVRTISFRTLLPFAACFDGMTVSLEFDRDALAEHARALETLWRAQYGDGFMQSHRGALWYLTKYFTPHPPGEPHFFVKPWAFVSTPRGWSSLVEGAVGEGWDVLRGVVATDVFHATPAVFLLRAPGLARIPARARLCDVYPVPRALLDVQVAMVRWADMEPAS